MELERPLEVGMAIWEVILHPKLKLFHPPFHRLSRPYTCPCFNDYYCAAWTRSNPIWRFHT
jgi:hypothetical protein